MSKKYELGKITFKGPFKIDEVELKLMKIVWDKGKIDINEAQANVQIGAKVQTNLIPKKLENLVTAGFLKKDSREGITFYSPKVSREQVAWHWHKHIDKMIFGGLPGEPISPEPYQSIEEVALPGEKIPPEPPDED